MTGGRRRKAPANGPTALYRFFDASGGLLYVGISSNLRKRWSYHATEQATTWWPLAVDRKVIWYDTRVAAARAEVQAIQNENPAYNVMHTERNRLPFGDRRGTIRSSTPTRGDQVLQCIRDRFSDIPFAQMDVLPHVPLCRSAVQKNFRALMLRGEIVAVGHRSDGNRGLGHVLYALAGSDIAQMESPIFLSSDAGQQMRAATVQGKNHRWAKYGRPPTPAAFRTLRSLAAHFGQSEFTRPQAATLTGLSMPGLLKHVISLEKHGFIQCVGRDKPVPGRSGHPHKVYAITRKAIDAPDDALLESHPDGMGTSGIGTARRTATTRFAPADLQEGVRQLFGSDSFTALQLATATGVPLPSVQQHVRTLADEGIIVHVGYEQREGPGVRACLWRFAEA